MSKWNPSNPDLAGDEWPGAVPAVQRITQALGQGPTLIAQASESIDTIFTVVKGSGGAVAPRLAVDIYDLADPLVDGQQVVMAIPGANFSNGLLWVKSTADVETPYDSDAWQNVDDVVSEADPINTGASTQLRYPGVNPPNVAQILFLASNADFFDGATGASGQTLAGKRIAAITVLAICENFSGHSVRMDGFLRLGDTRFASDSGPIVMGPNQGLTRLRFHFYTNPTTKQPWSQADATALTDGTNAFGTGVVTKSGGDELVVTTVALNFHTLVERRLATGFGGGAAADQWSGFVLVDPADNATPTSWAKNTGSRYFVCFSQIDRVAGQLFSINSSPVAGHENDLLFDSAIGFLQLGKTGIPVAALVEQAGQFCAMYTAASVPSIDSTPYADAVEQQIGSASPIAKQGISTESGQDYGTATVIVGATPDGRGGALQNDDLRIELHETAGDALIAGPVAITTDDVPPDGRYHLVRVQFSPPASLGGGEAVYLLALSNSTVGWRMPLLVHRSRFMDPSDAVSVAAATVGIGGDSDIGDDITTLDFPWSIGVAPPAPTGLSIDPAQIANAPLPSNEQRFRGAQEPLPTVVNGVLLQWDVSGTPVFGYYEIRRENPDGSLEIIARITDVDAPAFPDFECARGEGQETNYSLRVVRADGGASDWTAFPSPITVLMEGEADIVCASNFDPTVRAVAFKDIGGTHAWTPSQERVIQEIYGREDPVAFYGETGGEEFGRDLVVNANDLSVAIGGALLPDHEIFGPATTLLHNRKLPYVMYGDAWGNRWYTSPLITSTQRREPGGMYVASVTFTKVASLSAVVAVVP